MYNFRATAHSRSNVHSESAWRDFMGFLGVFPLVWVSEICLVCHFGVLEDGSFWESFLVIWSNYWSNNIRSHNITTSREWVSCNSTSASIVFDEIKASIQTVQGGSSELRPIFWFSCIWYESPLTKNTIIENVIEFLQKTMGKLQIRLPLFQNDPPTAFKQKCTIRSKRTECH